MNVPVNRIEAQQGFTLIELMLTLAIASILSTLAMMTFEEYTVRSKVKEGLDLIAPAKQAVADYYASKSALPSTNTLAALPAAASIRGQYTASVAVGANGVITVTYNSAETRIAARTLVLTPATGTGNIKWNCRLGSLEGRYRPSECR